MRKLAIVLALASTALATPALARDHSFYAGIEGGVISALVAMDDGGVAGEHLGGAFQEGKRR